MASRKSKHRLRYDITPVEALVLIYHVVNSEDAENDADRFVEEIVVEMDDFDGDVSKGLLESALYCCNMENERKQFWHPLGISFEKFVFELLPKDKHFDKYYNLIMDKEYADGHDAKTRR